MSLVLRNVKNVTIRPHQEWSSALMRNIWCYVLESRHMGSHNRFAQVTISKEFWTFATSNMQDNDKIYVLNVNVNVKNWKITAKMRWCRSANPWQGNIDPVIMPKAFLGSREWQMEYTKNSPTQFCEDCVKHVNPVGRGVIKLGNCNKYMFTNNARQQNWA